MHISPISNDAAVNVALDTIHKKKQSLVFCNTRRSSEATAERIAKKIKKEDPHLKDISQQALKVLSSPTKQCRRLAKCLRKGVAFHHAGLAAGQRRIIEDNFRKGSLTTICSTPTLAMGINLPAFRAIIKDLKRYGGRWGMQYIPTLEYHQMAGRAGRPDFNDTFGEAICIAKSEGDKEEILEKFIYAGPEEIYSKLAVEPVLRTYCLSLLATRFAKSKSELVDFFSKTFYGQQYGDMDRIEMILSKILDLLEEWGFIRKKSDDFISANEIGTDRVEVTKLGERVSELYLDPYTAHHIITSLRRATQMRATVFSYLQMAASTLEMRPLFTVRMKEIDHIEGELAELSDELITFEPSVFEPEYDDFLKSIKTSLAMNDWMDEQDEDYIMERYNIRPGEFHYKKEVVDWILYATIELANILSFRDITTEVKKTRYRLDKGVKEELIPLVRLKNIGRVRARKLFRNCIKDVGDVKKTDVTKLRQILGNKTAENLKEQVGQKVEKVPKGKRKGQMGLKKY